MEKILVTGGCGFIGSHTAVVLLEAGYNVVIADNLVNSSAAVVEKIETITNRKLKFCQIDVTEEQAVEELFRLEEPHAVIHFAGLKAVGESVEKPLAYYQNNLLSTIVLARCCSSFHTSKFVFSSSATVYGENRSPLVETMELLPTTNPYGETKRISERILSDFARTEPGFSLALLRYFNPVGAHPSGLIGEAPQGIPNNLMPYITRVAKGELPQLSIFGDDYPTPDGTGVRDYIHVMDLAEGHLAALENLKPGVGLYNLGTGKGTSVLELVKAFEEATGVNIPFRVTGRRPGDVAVCYADATRAEEKLNWKASRDLAAMCRDAWRFEKENS